MDATSTSLRAPARPEPGAAPAAERARRGAAIGGVVAGTAAGGVSLAIVHRPARAAAMFAAGAIGGALAGATMLGGHEAAPDGAPGSIGRGMVIAGSILVPAAIVALPPLAPVTARAAALEAALWASGLGLGGGVVHALASRA